MSRYTGLIDAYRERLPLPANARAISLGEGRTPLVQLQNITTGLGREFGFKGELYVLEYDGETPAKHGDWPPRVKKVGRDGTVVTLATVTR